MEYYSTQGSTARASFAEAVMRGIAPDGGLYMPLSVPRLPAALFNNIGSMNLREIAYVVAYTLMRGDVVSSSLHRIVNETLSFDIPLRRVTDSVYSLELYHGPTLSFKDVGARFLTRLVPHIAKLPVNMIVATAGDTGGAIANAAASVPGMGVFVIFPMGRMSQEQQAQCTAPGGNVHALSVNGTFDDCQRMAAELLSDPSLASLRLVSGNSVNIAKLLAQTVYFFHAYARLPESRRGEMVVGIPCGNLGNLTAAVMAKRMGLPIKRIVAVTNSNHAFADYLTTGDFKPHATKRTLATAMDVGTPTNMPRIIELYGNSIESAAADITARAYDDHAIASAIADCLEANSYLLDPHGATAYQALLDDLRPGEIGVLLETAHPAKFSDTVEAATGLELTRPAAIVDSLQRRRRPERIAPSADALKKYILANALR